MTPSFWMSMRDLAVPVADHLWQSTLYVAVVAAAASALRHDGAAVRYWLWLTASAKFLLPVGLLVAVGRRLGLSTTAAGLPASDTVLQIVGVSSTVTQPFSAVPMDPGTANVVTGASWSPSGAAVFGVIWAVGVVISLAAWRRDWGRAAAVVREATTLEDGPVVERLRRLERARGVARPTRLVESQAFVEPGVFGVLAPVIVWPRGLTERLSTSQADGVLAHEVAHVQRRDNVAAVVHRLARAAFWFYPVVAWVGGRLMDERERACDEAVVGTMQVPETYAESILRTCEWSVESLGACASGMSGADLKTRIERIMARPMGKPLRTWGKLGLATSAGIVLAGPVVLGLAAQQPGGTVRELVVVQEAPADGVVDEDRRFEVASVRPGDPDERRVMFLIRPGGRFEGMNVTVEMLIRQAYGLQNVAGDVILGAPEWISDERFVIEAQTGLEQFTPQMLQPMIRNLLVERFALEAHLETRERDVYELRLVNEDGRLGPGLERSQTDCAALAAARGRRGGTPPPPPPPGGGLAERPQCGIRMGGGALQVGGMTMDRVADALVNPAQRVVLDRTGLEGAYDFDLEFSMPRPPQFGAAGEPPAAGLGDSRPTIFTALQEQLGLKLEPVVAPVDVVVIDAIGELIPD